MKRKIFAALIATVAVFGTSACSGASEPPAAETQPNATPPESSTSETPAIDADTAQACLDLAGPLAEAGTKMASIATGELTEATTAMQRSYQALLEMCSV